MKSLVLGLLLAQFFPPQNTETTTIQVALENRTKHLVLAKSIQTAPNLVTLYLRNDYDRPLISFAVTQGASLFNTPDLEVLTARTPIKPGAVRELRVPAEALVSRIPVAISCVIFQDGTSDGDVAAVQRLEERWEFTRKEAGRLAIEIGKLAALAPAKLAKALDRYIRDRRSLQLKDAPRDVPRWQPPAPMPEPARDWMIAIGTARSQVRLEVRKTIDLTRDRWTESLNDLAAQLKAVAAR